TTIALSSNAATARLCGCGNIWIRSTDIGSCSGTGRLWRFDTRSSRLEVESVTDKPISALLPRVAGHQFVLYGDSCSGVPGALHERTFASVNAVIRRLKPQPEFILFLGDEIVGLTPDPDILRTQWKHWIDVEMDWLDRK